ncbi:unnamed protein product [Tilletia controversa]|uniref:tRNA-splicing endonuclease subunit Sen15 domain-containing protein n=3 Tax=Tilletia TaxID=13289 RepID=A0A8X7SWJ9_9BASI|nr:hypothetical protein CF336_g5821 [Tilletia laevis]KAE8194083.1 hypothetical protein CF328_g4864 [Tilletia controversa]KAE8256704.1 hypothetical protein A4X03_0g5142 [Tilletia caries]KAE8195519.1 hypothetical protein CF335_g5081 [Tilletia laevis]KAE8246511.1 hypothetical protein A4X06_0g4986 [Tilletia controversa]
MPVPQSTASLPSAHPSHAFLEPHLSAHPSSSAALLQTFTDLAHSARWTHLEPVLLDGVGIPALVGWKTSGDEKSDEQKPASVVVPLRTHDRLTPSFLAALFKAAHALPNPYTFRTSAHGPTLLGLPTAAEEPTQQINPRRVPLASDALTVAVLGPDGTVVYYNLAEGIRKPIN